MQRHQGKRERKGKERETARGRMHGIIAPHGKIYGPIPFFLRLPHQPQHSSHQFQDGISAVILARQLKICICLLRVWRYKTFETQTGDNCVKICLRVKTLPRILSRNQRNLLSGNRLGTASSRFQLQQKTRCNDSKIGFDEFLLLSTLQQLKNRISTCLQYSCVS